MDKIKYESELKNKKYMQKDFKKSGVGKSYELEKSPTYSGSDISRFLCINI